MSEQEMLDIYNENMEHVGTVSREEAHAKGLWHQTFQCWLIRREGDKQYVLFQRRGPDKKLFPNVLDITAAGHLLQGETTADGVRELNEELGLSARTEDLVYLGIKHDCALVGSVVNREFANVYLLESNKPLDEYNLQPDEVTGLVQMEISDGLKLFSGEANTATTTGFQVDMKGTKQPISIQVSRSDIIPRVDNYYLKIFIMAERYFQGIPYLSI